MAFPVAGYGQGQKRSAVGGANSGLQLLLSLINQQQGGFDEAKQANESRYQDILELFGNNRARTLGLLDNFGKSLVDDSNRTYDDKRKELLTDLADRGLSGSTARIGVETGVKRERDAALNRIKDMLVQDTTNADLGFTDRAAGVMERRDDPYPENSQSSALIGQLINALAAGGGGGGGGLAGLLGGGASSLRQDPTRALRMQALEALAQPTQPAFNTNGLSQDEIQRRNNMLGLFLAESPNTGTYVGDKEKAALSQLLASGQSQYNPSQVGAALIDRTPRQPIFYGSGGGYGDGPSYRPHRDYGAVRSADRARGYQTLAANRNNPSARWQPGAGQREGAQMLANIGNTAAGAIGSLAALGGLYGNQAAPQQAALPAIQPATPPMPRPQSPVPSSFWNQSPPQNTPAPSPFSSALYQWMDQFGVRRMPSNVGPQPYNQIPGAQSFGAARDPYTGLSLFDTIPSYFRY